MHRQPVIELLQRHREAAPGDHALCDRFLAFVAAHDDCLLRSCVPGHITASAWILSPDGHRALLTHHRKLDRWLQLGGHVDGEADLHQAALREAREESGMEGFRLCSQRGGVPLPLDLDVHPIPARGDEPRHDHWDVRFWLQAAPGQALAISAESVDLRWFTPAELAAVTTEESVLRLQRKVGALRGS